MRSNIWWSIRACFNAPPQQMGKWVVFDQKETACLGQYQQRILIKQLNALDLGKFSERDVVDSQTLCEDNTRVPEI